MDVFNRIVVVLALLLLATVLVWAMLQPLFIVEVLELTAGGLEEVVYSNYFLYLGVAALSLFIVLVFLWLELRRRTRKTVRVHQVSSGDVELNVSSISQSLEYFVNGLEGVIRVKPKILGRGKSVDVVLNVETRPDVDVPSKTDEICQVVREVVEGRLGLGLRKIRANIKHAPYPRGSKPQESGPVTPAPFAMPQPERYVAPVELVSESVSTEVLTTAPLEEPAEEEEPGESTEYVLPPLDGVEDFS